MSTPVAEVDGVPAASTDTSAGGPSLSRNVGRGALWAAGSNILLRLAGIGVTAVLARLLSPQDFGVFAVALAVHVVVASMAELGMASAVARSASEPDDIAPTVATISMGVSLALGAAMALFAGSIAAAVGVPDAAEPLRVLAISLVLTGVFAVPGAQLTREFRQDRIFLATVAGFVPANALLVGLAMMGGGATAFAWSRVVGQLVTGAVLIACLNRRYLPGWRRSVVKPLLLFGLPLSAANLVNWSLLNADYVIVGRLLDATHVGVYMIAFSVAGWSTAVLGSVLNGVVVPAFGRVRDDSRQLGAALVSGSRLVALVAMPVGVLTVALAGPLVATVFGRTWLDAVPVLGVLAAYGVLFAFSLLYANVLIAVGATGRLLAIQLVWIAALVPAMVVGIDRGGLVGAAWAHVVVISLVAIPAYLSVVSRLTGQRLRPVLGAAALPLAAALAAGLVARVVDGLTGPAWQGLLIGGLTGGLTYLALTWPLVRPLLATLTSDPSGPATPALPGPRPLRIAIGIEGLALGGCPLNAVDLGRTLRERGHDVTIFAVDEDVRVSWLPYAERAGFDVTVVPSRAGLLARARDMRELVDRLDVEVLHVYAPWLGPAASLALWRRPGRVAVVTNWTMENAFWTAPHTPMIVGTAAMRAEALPRHRSPVWLMEPTVDLARERTTPEAAAAFRHDHAIADDEILVSLVGRVDRAMKLEGIIHAIDAVERLDEPRLRLAVVGDGDAMAEVRERAARVNASLGRTAIVLVGALIDPRPAYAAADVVLAMGGSALRGLAHAKPVIVLGERGFARTFGPASLDYFLDVGFFGQEPVDDPAGHLACLVRELLDADRIALGVYGEQAVSSRFGLDVAATTLVEVYADALESPPRPGARVHDAIYLLARHVAHDLRLLLARRAREER